MIHFILMLVFALLVFIHSPINHYKAIINLNLSSINGT